MASQSLLHGKMNLDITDRVLLGVMPGESRFNCNSILLQVTSYEGTDDMGERATKHLRSFSQSHLQIEPLYIKKTVGQPNVDC